MFGEPLGYPSCPNHRLRISFGGEVSMSRGDRNTKLDEPVTGTEPQGMFGTLDRLFGHSRVGQNVSKIGVCQREVRVQFQGVAECSHPLGELMVAPEHHAFCQMSPSIAIIEAKR